MLKLIKNILGITVAIWMLLTFATFGIGFTISEFGCPSWLQLPWSDVKDFVETSDGKIFVSSGFYRQVIAYDENGNFIESHPYPYGKFGQLAVDDFDNIYFWSNGDVFVYDKNWKQIKTVSKPSPNCECNSWRLDDNEQLICLTEKTDKQRVISKAVEKGAVLLSYESEKRTIFNNKSGSSLHRDWFTITRYSADGKVLTEYGTPWYLIWAVFPFPGILAWAALFISARWNKLKKRS